MMPESGNEQREKPAKRRAQMSCDRCKMRKTKCVDPVPGPCQFCASINAACHVDVSRRRQRPYYQVSEEEFRYMTRALEHFMPETTLNLANLRDFVQSISDGKHVEKPGMTVRSPAGTDGSGSRPGTSGAGAEKGDMDLPMEPFDGVFNRTPCLMRDAKGIERFIAPRSAQTFQSIVTNRLHPAIPQPIRPPTPPSSMPLPHRESAHPSTQVFLPRRDLMDRCLNRFFADIHSVYWLFHRETLVKIIDGLYAGNNRVASLQMLCCLYCILALTGESEAKRCGVEVDAHEDPSAKYLLLAKGMVGELYDKADIDSVRAFCLLALLHHPVSPQQAYFYSCAAVKVACSLALPIKHKITTQTHCDQEISARLLITVYVLDLDVSLPLGYPPAFTTDDFVSQQLSRTSEQILCAESFSPPGYQNLIGRLSQIARAILSKMYPSLYSDEPRCSLREALGVISDLHAWWGSLPEAFLRPESAAPGAMRAVFMLHLRYHMSMMVATRPFLLYAIDSTEGETTPRMLVSKELLGTCISAAGKTLDLCQALQSRNLLSGLVAMDIFGLIDCIQIFLLFVVANTQNHAHLAQTYLRKIHAALTVLATMEQTPAVQAARYSIAYQMRLRGIPEPANPQSHRQKNPGNSASAGVVSMGEMQSVLSSTAAPVMSGMLPTSFGTPPRVDMGFDSLFTDLNITFPMGFYGAGEMGGDATNAKNVNTNFMGALGTGLPGAMDTDDFGPMV